MDLTGAYRIPAPRPVVWAALNDTTVLQQCIPGCEDVTRVSDTELTATARLKVGPVSAKFTGKVTLSDLDPPAGYTIRGEGQGGAAGFGSGGARVRLEEEAPDVTLLTYEADAQVGGKLAQVGSRLVEGAAKKLADDFFARFAALLSGPGPDPHAADPAPLTAAPDGPATDLAALPDDAGSPLPAATPGVSQDVPPAEPVMPSPATPAAALEPLETEGARPGIRPLVWVPLLILLLLVIILATTRL